MTDDEYADYEAQIEKLVASAIGEVEKATSEKRKGIDDRIMAEEKKVPRHIGFIMDGNGRWAKLRGKAGVTDIKRSGRHRRSRFGVF